MSRHRKNLANLKIPDEKALFMEDFEIYQSRETETSLNYSGNELKIKEINTENGYGIRVVNNSKIGFSYCQKEEDIKQAMKQAQNLSRYSEKTSFTFAQKTRYNEMGLFDKKISEKDLMELKDIVNEAVDAINSKGANARVILNEVIEKIKIENTNGIDAKYRKTIHSLYIEAMEGTGMGFCYGSSIRRDTKPYEMALDALEMAKNMKKAKKIESGKYNVVINVQALEGLLEIILPSFSGEWKRKKITKLSFGDKFSNLISMYENPFCGAIGDRPFDDEAVASRTMPLIEKGRVKSFLFDRETAALAKENSQGNCSRSGYGSNPTISHTNIEIKPGELENVEEIGKHVEIISMHGSHTSNPTTGDFGMEVNIAFINGKPVRGFIMSGNIFDLLNNVIGLEKKQTRYANILAPKIAFSEVDLIG